MFEFISRIFRKKKKPTGIIKLSPEHRQALSIDPSKDKVIKDVGDLPDTDEIDGIKKTEGHICFNNNVKTITRNLKRKKLRQSLEERKTSFYNDHGKLYGEDG
jgi:hypothetical protein